MKTAGAGLHGRWRRTDLRTRVTLLAGAALALALLAGAVLLVSVLRSGLTGAVDDRARQRVVEVQALIAADRLPPVIPAADPTVLVQVVDTRGAVVAATTGTSRVVTLLSPSEVASAVRSGDPVQVEADRVASGGGLRVQARPASVGGLTILAAVSVTAVDDPLRLVRLALLVGLPLLLLASMAGVWATVGRTLRPVAALRAGAEAVTSDEPSRRLPTPASDDEIRRLADTLNGMLDRLEAGGTRQRAFVADAAHELRSPLAALRTTLEVAVLHPAPTESAEVLTSALEDVLRMGRLVEDLLLLARQGAGAGRPVRRVDLARVAAAVVQEVTARPGRLPVHLQASSAVVLAEPTALARVVRNLLENALRHASSSVEVGVGVVEGQVELTIDDDGTGIAAADRDRIFERFTRLDTPRSRGAGGSGLGLAIVRDVVASLGGTVSAAAASSGGARLRVTLPPASPTPVASADVRTGRQDQSGRRSRRDV